MRKGGERVGLGRQARQVGGKSNYDNAAVRPQTLRQHLHRKETTEREREREREKERVSERGRMRNLPFLIRATGKSCFGM